MRLILKCLAVLKLILVIAAAVFYEVYLKVGQYSYTGTPPSPPSAEVAPDADWQSLFDGDSLTGWQAKIVGRPAGDNYRNTFRAANGVLSVNYDEYDEWQGEFGHLFYETPFSHYILQLEYRFVGEQIAEGSAMAWAWRNSGIMLHSQSADTMALNQDFPVSLEGQLLGAHEGEHRPTANLCTPGTHVYIHGQLHTQHCMKSQSASFPGDQWVSLEIEVKGSERIRHFINGELAIEYTQPQLDTWGGDGKALADQGAAVSLTQGYIALQSESHPVEFRNIRLLPLTKEN